MSACRQCGAGAEAVGCLSYAGCPSCRPEVKEDQGWRRSGVDGAPPSAPGAPAPSEPGKTLRRPKEYPKGSTAVCRLSSLVCAVQLLASVVGRVGQPVDIAKNPIYHIVEEPGGIDRMTSVEVPTERYYEALRQDLGVRHPGASPFVLDHLVSLEACLDVSICSGFSFGCAKASILVSEGNLLGRVVGRDGVSGDVDRAEAVRKFAPMKGGETSAAVLGMH